MIEASSAWFNLSLTKKMERFMEIFPTITKDESDYITQILRWDDETRSAFILAKSIFENVDE